MDIEVEGNLRKWEIRDSCRPNCEVQGTYQHPRLIAREKTCEKKRWKAEIIQNTGAATPCHSTWFPTKWKTDNTSQSQRAFMNMIMPQQEWMGLKYGTNHSASTGSRTTYTSRTCLTAKPTPEGGRMELHVNLKLNNKQVMRLLAGYCSLISYWEWLRLKPLYLPLWCMVMWERCWVSAVGRRLEAVRSMQSKQKSNEMDSSPAVESTMPSMERGYHRMGSDEVATVWGKFNIQNSTLSTIKASGINRGKYHKVEPLCSNIEAQSPFHYCYPKAPSLFTSTSFQLDSCDVMDLHLTSGWYDMARCGNLDV